MIKIPLSENEHASIVKYGKELFDLGLDGGKVYASLVGYCRDNFGFWMTQEQATIIIDASLLEYSSSIK